MHPSDRRLIDYLLEDDRSVARRNVERHLQGRGACEPCRGRLRAYEQLFATLRGDRDPEPPATWVERAIRLRAAGGVLERVRAWCAGRREALARLVFDSAGPADVALAGTRHVQSGRRVRFESGSLELDLQAEPDGRGGTVTGQLVLLAPRVVPLVGARLLVTVGDVECVEATTDELGEFTVNVSRTGDLRVRVLADGELTLFAVPDPAS